jgi:hypothetical protein
MFRQNGYIIAAFGNITKRYRWSLWSLQAALVGLKSHCRRQPQASIWAQPAE